MPLPLISYENIVLCLVRFVFPNFGVCVRMSVCVTDPAVEVLYKKPKDQADFYKPVDMAEVRKKLGISLSQAQTITTELPAVDSSTKKPQLRFQSDPNLVKRWDWHNNQWMFVEGDNNHDKV